MLGHTLLICRHHLESMRVFVEVPLPDELKEKIGKLGKEVEQEGIRLVKPQNMHATLKFLGEVPEKKLADIEQKLRQVRFSSFRCSIKGVGVFPSESYIRVLWVGVESSGQLEKLAEEVIGALQGYGKDDRFSAHITMARVKKKVNVSKFLEEHKNEELGEFEINTFNLMESVLSREGPAYSVIASFTAEEKNV